MEAFTKRYTDAFATQPQIRADLLGRIVTGRIVVDHEALRATPDAPVEEALVVYEAAGDKISRMWFIEPPSSRRPR